MKKFILITLCSIMSFAFTSVKENKVEEIELQQSICDQGSIVLTFYKDCDGDGTPDLYFTSRVCKEHITAMSEFAAQMC